MKETFEQAQSAFERADCLYTAEQMAAVYDRMAADIQTALAGRDPVILSVMMGGFTPTAELTKRLSLPFEFDYLHATRYRGEGRGGELVWKVSPSISITDRHVLVIDDILDEGKTLEATLQALLQQAPASVQTAIVLEKQHDRRDPQLHADFKGVDVPDRYVFGAGMDYLGYFRNLPGVYALPADIDTTQKK